MLDKLDERTLDELVTQSLTLRAELASVTTAIDTMLEQATPVTKLGHDALIALAVLIHRAGGFVQIRVAEFERIESCQVVRRAIGEIVQWSIEERQP